MGSSIENLHTAARRYCIDRYGYSLNQYLELKQKRNGNQYTAEALNLFPRYQILNAILVEIEGFIPENFPTLEEARKLLSLAGQTAKDSFIDNQGNPIGKRAIEEERKGFISFIQSISQLEIDNVEPLPYRRVLTTRESQQVWAKMRDTWGMRKLHGSWYPITNDDPKGGVAFQANYFHEEVGVETLRDILSKRGIMRVWDLKETGPESEYEKEIDEFEPYYSGTEGYWCSTDMDWLIYVSHENSITISGWLLDAVKKVWPNWKERVWTGIQPIGT